MPLRAFLGPPGYYAANAGPREILGEFKDHRTTTLTKFLQFCLAARIDRHARPCRTGHGSMFRMLERQLKLVFFVADLGSDSEAGETEGDFHSLSSFCTG